MHLVRAPALVLAALSALLPTLVVALVLIPSLVPLGFVPRSGLLYVLFASWILTALFRAIFYRRFTALERSVLGFWAHTLFLILVVCMTLGAFPLLVFPALGSSLGWSFLTSSLYLRSAALTVLLLSAVLVWVLWRRHWNSLVASLDAEGRAA